MRQNPNETPDRPASGLSWRDPVLWLLIGPPLGAVLGGILTVWIAVSRVDPLVSDTIRKAGVTWKESAPAATNPTTAPTPAAEPARDDRGG